MASKTAPTWSRPKAYRTFTIGFGLVNIEIAIGTLFEDGRVSGKYLCPEHREPVSQRWYCEAGDHIVDRGEGVEEKRFSPVTGYAWETTYVVPEETDLLAIKEEIEKEMEIERIVPVSSIDPAYYGHSYLVWPKEGTRNEAAFAILSTALRAENRAAVGRIVLNRTQQTLVIRWSEHFATMVGHLCKFDEDVRWENVHMLQDSIETMPPPKKSEIAAARPLIAALDGDFEPSDLVDEYRQELWGLIETTANGKKRRFRKRKAADVAPTDELMEALKASVGKVKKRERVG